ncbi:helix-turn-helix domain-containing protein [Pedobacter hiemivivus]|uniref:Transcriptional regulator n=1 Tax=Pedobacter hiemivivus TaxID=2530454 RepID=A0A4R0N470_9SPHI|nr:helix-turn-helix domain-containing protein [Pedobacter hiemivivus]TCC94709.1 transcriptional regulator [Pedobacter hiemivivus]
MTPIITFIKEKRKALKLSQANLAFKSGVGLRFVRELERGRATVRLDKVNQVLALFGKQIGITDLNHKEQDEN